MTCANCGHLEERHLVEGYYVCESDMYCRFCQEPLNKCQCVKRDMPDPPRRWGEVYDGAQ